MFDKVLNILLSLDRLSHAGKPHQRISRILIELLLAKSDIVIEKKFFYLGNLEIF